MAQVLCDFTRLTSAFGHVSERPHLFLHDLARLVETIVLYDRILTTVPADALARNAGLQANHGNKFDFTKQYVYAPLFRDVFADVPEEVDMTVYHAIRGLRTTQFDEAGRLYCAADVAALPDVREQVSQQDFLFDFDASYTDAQLLNSMERVRTLLMLARDLRLGYDPIPFRIPLVQYSCPANVTSKYLLPYRRFENDIYGFLEEVCGTALALELPLLFNIVMAECSVDDPDSIFAVAVQLRTDPLMVRLREIFGQFTDAFGQANTALLAQMARHFKDAANETKRRWSAEIGSSWDLKLKFDVFPVEAKLDLRSIVRGIKDREFAPAVANLGGMTRRALATLPVSLNKIERMFGMQVPASDVIRVSSMGR